MRSQMVADRSDPIDGLAKKLADLYVIIEDFTEEASTGSLLKVLAHLWDLHADMERFERSAVAVLKRHQVSWTEIASSLGIAHEAAMQRFAWSAEDDGPAERRLAALLKPMEAKSGPELVKGEVYSRADLRELFSISDATINNGVFPVKQRAEVWLFITENKPADREQYIDKLVGDTLYWQGQRFGRTDSLIIDHKRIGEKLLVFYRRAKYEFDGAAFRYEGIFDYVSHSGSNPTDFILRRSAS
jgi:hypothetical protein